MRGLTTMTTTRINGTILTAAEHASLEELRAVERELSVRVNAKVESRRRNACRGDEAWLVFVNGVDRGVVSYDGPTAALRAFARTL